MQPANKMLATPASGDEERLDERRSAQRPSLDELKAHYVLQMANTEDCLSEDYNLWLRQLCALWHSGLFGEADLINMSDGRSSNDYFIRKTIKKYPLGDNVINPTAAFKLAAKVLGETFQQFLIKRKASHENN